MKSIKLSWNAVTNDAQGTPLPEGVTPTYKVYGALVGSNYTTPNLETAETTATISLASAGASKVCVTAHLPDGDSAQSNQVNFTSVPLTPAAPTGLVIVP